MLKTNEKTLASFKNKAKIILLATALVAVVYQPSKAGKKPVSVQNFHSLHGADWSFGENKGQLNNTDIKYYGIQGGVNIYCKPGKISFAFKKAENDEKVSEATGESIFTSSPKEKLSPAGGGKGWKNDISANNIQISYADLILIGSNPNSEITASDEQEYVENYYTNGNAIDNVHTFKTITYNDIYPHIDLVLQSKERSMEYSFIVRPGGNVDDIKLQWNGLENIKQLQNGGIEYAYVGATGGSPSGGLANKKQGGRLVAPTFTESAPYSYQQSTIGNQQYTIHSKFITHNSKLSFQVSHYDKTRTLVIDPTLSWGTYYGGSSAEDAWGVSTDSSGNLYITGYTTSASGIATAGAYQTSYSGTGDAYIAKFSKAGSLLWATYFGGNNVNEAFGISLDNKGNIYIAGATTCTSGIATSGAFQTSFGGGSYDAFLAKFSNSGTRTWATYFGGTGLEEATGVRADDSGNVYISGFSTSTSGIATAGAYQTSFAGLEDAYLAKFSGSGSQLWASYYGGSGVDFCYGITTDSNSDAYITGYTTSTSGIATAGAYQTSNAGGYDVYLAKFSHGGSLSWATYYGGSGIDEADGIGADGIGNIYITGETKSTSGIATSGVYQTSLAGVQNAFLAEFSNKGNLNMATYFGGNKTDNGVGVSVDANGNVYVAGNTFSTTGIATAGAYQTSFGGLGDAFSAKFDSSFGIISATYYGGPASDNAIAAFADNSGNEYIIGYTQSTSGIATSGAYQTANAGGQDAFIAKFSYGACSFQPAINGKGPVCTHTTQSSYYATKHNTNTYSWLAIGGTISSGKNADSVNIDWTRLGSDTLWLFETNGACKDSVMESVSVMAGPVANAGGVKEICASGNAVIMGASAYQAAWKYSWTSIPSGFTSTLCNPIATPTITTQYILTIKDTMTGCTSAPDTMHLSLGVPMSLPYVTYYGGVSIDDGNAMTVDKFGNTYITGLTISDSGIATKGAYQTSRGGGEDAFLAKFNCAGNLEWATYYGDSGNDIGSALIADDSGNVYLAGYTESKKGIASAGSFQSSYGGGTYYGDAFLVKFNSSGQRQWGTYFGGSSDDYALGITFDKKENLYITGVTYSSSGIATSGAFITSNSIGDDAFLAKFTKSGSRVWGTYYGGYGYRVAPDDSGNIYLTGNILGGRIVATSGAYQTSNAGANDAYLAKFDSTGSLLWATYFGGKQDEFGLGIITDGSNVYMAGTTLSNKGIATSGAYQTSFGGGTGTGDVFLAKFNSAGAIQWSTYYGGKDDETEDGLQIGANNKLYIAGNTASANGIATSGAFQTALSRSGASFIARFSLAGAREYGTYDSASGATYALTLDNSDNIYISGTIPENGLATSGAYQTSLAGGNDAFFAKLNLSPCSFSPTINGNSSQCQNTGSNYYATKHNANTYSWKAVGGTINSGQNNDTVSVQWGTAGNDTLWLFETNGTCKDSIMENVSVGQTPTAYAGAGQEICQAGNAVIIGPSARMAAWKYTWTSLPSGFTSTLSNPVVAPTVSTQYILTITDALSGCTSAPDTMQVSIGTPMSTPYGTYFGGSGIDEGNSIAQDKYGNTYIAGQTYSTSGIATSGAYQTSNGGGYDAFLAKYDCSGNLQWATFYGGNAGDEAYGVTTDDSGNVYLTGETNSTNGIATSGAYQTSQAAGNYDAFVAKFTSSGSFAWGTYYGGSGTTIGKGICIDANNDIYITGLTYSTYGIATSGAYLTSIASEGAFVAKFTSVGNLVWGTYYGGGGGGDGGTGIVVDSNNNVCITGFTGSTIGIATSGAYQTSFAGGTYDAFIAKFTSTGSLTWATYYGGGGYDNGYGIAADGNNNIYITGFTESSNGIASSGANQTAFAGSSDVFVAKFSSSGSLAWGTYYGGSDYEYGYGITKDANNNVYVTGYTQSTSGIATSGAYQTSHTTGGYPDAFVAKFTSSGNLFYGTYYGGGYDGGQGIIVDANNNVYFTGYTQTTSGIATSGAYQTSYAGNQDAFFAKLSTPSPCSLTPLISGKDTQCQNTVASYNAVINGANAYSWEAIGGSIASVQNTDTINIKWTNAGNDTLWLFESNGTCKDSVMQVVLVSAFPNPAVVGDTALCQGGSAVYSTANHAGSSYKWAAAGGTITAGQIADTVYVTWPNAGIHTVKIWETNISGCTDSTMQDVWVYGYPNSVFSANAVCAGNATQFKDTFAANESYHWSFGDNDSSLTSNPSHLYAKAGTYNVVLKMKNGGGCIDSTSNKVTVNPLPKANTGSASFICLGSGTTIGDTAVSGDTYSWISKPTGFTSTGAGASPAPTVTTTYYLTETITASGCSKSDSVVVNVNPLPKAKTGTTSFICLGSGGAIGDTAVNGDTYSWTSRPSGFTSTSASPSITPTLNTTYYLTEKVTSTGCSKSDSVVVQVGSKPSVSAGSNDTICTGNGPFALLSGTPSGGVWTGHKVRDSSGTYYFHPEESGQGGWYLHYTYSSSGCGADSDSISIAVYQSPNVKITPPLPLCNNDSPEQIVATPASGTWYSPSGALNSSGLFDPTKVKPGTYKIYYSYSIFGHCGSEDSINIIVDSVPMAAFTTKSDSGNTYTFIASDTNAASSYIWSLNGGNGIMGTKISITLPISTSNTMELQVTSKAQCTSTHDTVLSTTTALQPFTPPVYNIDVYPNPFTNQTTITYHLIQSANIRIEVTDMEGKVIAMLTDAGQAKGDYTQTFLPSKYNMQAGIYFLRVYADGAPVTKKIIKID